MRMMMNRILPVLLAVGLWMMGNVLMTTKPVKGQAGEVPGVPACTHYTVTDSHHECSSPVNGVCSGGWSETVDGESDCEGTSGDPQHPCMPGLGPTEQVTTIGTCQAKIIVTPVSGAITLCIHGPVSDVIFVDIPSVPQCSTSNPPPNTV